MTPDGVTIEFRGHLRGGWNPSYCNVYIKTPSDYQTRTFGLCGNTNGKQNDEFMSKDEKTVFQSYSNVVASLDYTNEWKYVPVIYNLLNDNKSSVFIFQDKSNFSKFAFVFK